MLTPIFAEQPDSPLAAAILQTVLYADVFDFALTDAEICHFLIGSPATYLQVCATLAESRWLHSHIARHAGEPAYYTLCDRLDLAEQRPFREASSAQLWPSARRYGLLLAHLPWVRMVALTGALAVRNARPGDDIDYLLVTAAGRVWLTRALAVIVVRLARLRGVRLCPNYVLAESALAQAQHDLYIAHEIAQMIPLAGFDLYNAFRRANRWTDRLLPNAQTSDLAGLDSRPRKVGRLLQRAGEWLLSGHPGDRLEQWEQRRKIRKFAQQAQAPHASAQLDAAHVKGHFNDYGYPILQRYHERLHRCGLTTIINEHQAQ